MMNAIICTNIGTMTLGDFEVDFEGDSLELSMFFDVVGVNAAVESIILDRLTDLKFRSVLEYPDEAEAWFDADLVITGKCLHVSVNDAGKLETYLLIDYEDAHNPRLWGTAQISVDFSAQEQELRQFIVYSVLKKLC